MTSRAQKRKARKLSGQYRRSKASFCLPLPKKLIKKGGLQILAQEHFSQKILREDLHKLVDPHFFKDPKFTITQNIFDALYNKEIRTVGDVTQKTEAELLELPGIGAVRLKKIKEALAALGLALKL